MDKTEMSNVEIIWHCFAIFVISLIAIGNFIMGDMAFAFGLIFVTGVYLGVFISASKLEMIRRNK